MSEQWTPKADDFRQVWAAFNGYGGLVTRPHSVSMDEGYAEFDRWLAGVKADAWDEAYAQGVDDERISESNIGIAGLGGKVGPCRRNPYRQEADQ